MNFEVEELKKSLRLETEAKNDAKKIALRLNQ